MDSSTYSADVRIKYAGEVWHVGTNWFKRSANFSACAYDSGCSLIAKYRKSDIMWYRPYTSVSLQASMASNARSSHLSVRDSSGSKCRIVFSEK